MQNRNSPHGGRDGANFGNKKNSSFKVNQEIRARVVKLIDEDSSMLGDVSLPEALSKAEERGLDLVEISPQASPPVCKIMNYDKFRYKEQKKKVKTKSSAKKMKELKFGINISDHDFDFKVKHAEDFLKFGHSVRFLVSLRGREMRHKELAHELMQRIIEKLKYLGSVQDSISYLGNKVIATFLPSNQKVKPVTSDENKAEVGGTISVKSESAEAQNETVEN